MSIVTISVACSTVLSFPVQADFVYELDSDWNLAGAVEEHNITTFTTDDNIKKIWVYRDSTWHDGETLDDLGNPERRGD